MKYTTGDKVIFIADEMYYGIKVKGKVCRVDGPAAKRSDFDYTISFKHGKKTYHFRAYEKELVPYVKGGLTDALYL